MRRLAATLAVAAFLLTASTAAAQTPTPDPAPISSGHQECMYVAPHFGRQAPAAAYNLHVFDYTNSLPIFRAYTNSEGWYFTRVYPATGLAKILWHSPKDGIQWISNFSGVPVAACFFVP